MKRKTRRSPGQLAVVLEAEDRTSWPAETQSALVTALAELLLEAVGLEMACPIQGGDRDEPEDHT